MVMLDEKLGAQKRFAFTSKAVPAGTFAVVDLSGTEAISKPYEFDLTLISDNHHIALESIIDQHATLTIYPREQGVPPVLYHGLVKEFDQSYQIGSYALYRAQLAPRVWDLSLDKISEVYLDQSIPQIIDQELRGLGLTASDFELKLSHAYKPWSYLCQYQETDLDFIARLMEREGMYYYFDQDAAREKLVITDFKTFHSASARLVEYRPAAQLETGSREDLIHTWLCRQRPLPRKVVLQDFNAEMAAVALMAESEVSAAGKGEVRIYGEDFRTPAEGQRLAKIRAEELLSRQRVFHGDGTATGLRAGFFMQLQGHYRQDFNGRYLLTEVRHEGSQGAALLAGTEARDPAGGREREDFYRSECSAIPAGVQFRPTRVTPRSLFHGTMTAFIDAEGSGQYAELDSQGRYKVQLPFDKTDKGPDKASAWIRMATPYSGKDHGMHFPLHKGTEVLLSFVDGDPNQPVIIGAVPNSENPSLVTQSNQTQSIIHTAGGNRIAIEDQEGSKRMTLSSPTNDSWVRIGAHNDPSPAFTSSGLALYTTDALGIQTQMWNCLVLGEVSSTVLGMSTTITSGWNFTINLGGATTIALPERLQFTPFETDATGEKITAITQRIDVTEQSIKVTNQEVQAVTSRVDATANKIEACENTLTAHNQELAVVDSKITAVNSRVDAVDEQVTATNTRVDATETEIQTIETAVSAVEMDVRNSGMAMTNTDLFIIS